MMTNNGKRELENNPEAIGKEPRKGKKEDKRLANSLSIKTFGFFYSLMLTFVFTQPVCLMDQLMKSFSPPSGAEFEKKFDQVKFDIAEKVTTAYFDDQIFSVKKKEMTFENNLKIHHRKEEIKAIVQAIKDSLSRDNLKNIALFLIAVFTIWVIVWHLIPELIKWIFLPPLPPIISKKYLPLPYYLRWLGLKSNPAPSRLKDMVYNPKVSDKLHHLIKLNKAMEKESKRLGRYANSTPPSYDNLLFYGQPGVGKTLFAQELGYYILVPSALISQLPTKEALKQVRHLIETARRLGKQSSSCVTLIIDEGEALLASRKGANANELTRLCVNMILALVPFGSQPYFRLLICTNHPDLLSVAILNRLSKWICIDRPDANSCKRLLELYFDKYKKEAIRASGKQILLQKGLRERFSSLGLLLYQRNYVGRGIQIAMEKLFKDIRYLSTKKRIIITEKTIKRYFPTKELKEVYQQKTDPHNQETVAIT